MINMLLLFLYDFCKMSTFNAFAQSNMSLSKLFLDFTYLLE